MDSNVNEEVESILYIGREVSVYRIPPLKANEGHRANDWGDLSDPLWKGRVKIVETSKGVVLYFEDAHNGESFAKAEYDPKRPSVEAVLDSSRYFVVRVEDAGRKAYIGMGFAERSDSFDFNVALQDYTKRWKAKLDPHAEEDIPSPHLPAGPKKDYSLKEGQTFSISIPGRTKEEKPGDFLNSTILGSSSTGGSVPLLPPPPTTLKKSG